MRVSDQRGKRGPPVKRGKARAGAKDEKKELKSRDLPYNMFLSYQG